MLLLAYICIQRQLLFAYRALLLKLFLYLYMFQDDSLLSYHIFNVTTCSPSPPGALQLSFTLWLFLYFAIVFIVSLFILRVLNRTVSSKFRDEALHSSRALFLSIFPLMAFFLSDWISIGTLYQYYKVYSSLSMAALFFNLTAEVVVFGPVVSL